MPRKKQKHIDAVEDLENVFGRESKMESLWQKKYFKNQAPIVLELACGHGHYTLGLAQNFPEKNFIGVDRKGDRIWKGASKAGEQKLKNVAFLRCLIEDLDEYFAENEVYEIWITFPDPFPKPSKANKRLTSPKFLDIYRKILKPGGKIHLKTDDAQLFYYSLEVAEATKCLIEEKNVDLHGQDRLNDAGSKKTDEGFDPLRGIRTYYEDKFMKEGKNIFYLRFSFRG